MDLKYLIESLLFASGEPLKISRIAALTQEKAEKILGILKELKEEYEEKQRGIRLLNKGNEWILVAAPEASKYIQKLKQEVFEDNLTPAVAETLAIVAYKGPITRAHINEIRGVDATYALRQLLLRGLIERKRDPQRSNTFLYSVSLEFLKHLGLSNIKDLPEYEQLRNIEI
ncbi:SMC-Scp complex subunit ScpB [bacterium]|nr:SMC-Scp complex subunit ScpB [bacterium]